MILESHSLPHTQKHARIHTYRANIIEIILDESLSHTHTHTCTHPHIPCECNRNYSGGTTLFYSRANVIEKIPNQCLSLSHTHIHTYCANMIEIILDESISHTQMNESLSQSLWMSHSLTHAHTPTYRANMIEIILDESISHTQMNEHSRIYKW